MTCRSRPSKIHHLRYDEICNKRRMGARSVEMERMPVATTVELTTGQSTAHYCAANCAALCSLVQHLAGLGNVRLLG
jgi:hypothetical protein